jgi:hypothetical protein
MEDKLGSLFFNTANALNSLYKDSHAELENYKIRGKKDFYQESLKWMIESNSGDLKFVKIDDFLQVLKSQRPEAEPARVQNTIRKKYKPCN